MHLHTNKQTMKHTRTSKAHISNKEEKIIISPKTNYEWRPVSCSQVITFQHTFVAERRRITLNPVPLALFACGEGT